MKYKEFVEKIQSKFKKSTFSVGDLIYVLKLRKNLLKKINKYLKKMLKEGHLLEIDNNLYILKEREKLLEGVVSCHRDGYGFLLPDNPEEKDVFLPPKTLKNVYDGDRVLVRVINKRNRNEGQILKVLERGIKKVVGIIKKKNKQLILQPIDDKLYWPLVIVSKNKILKDIKTDDFVVGRIINYPEKGYGTVDIEEKIEGTDYDAEIKRLLLKANISEEYPYKAVKEIENYLKAEIPDLKQRKDLTKLMFITIDGEQAKDFDDAVYIKKNKSGYKLYVAIADVSHYVMENSFLDKEALYRGNSYYFPDRVYPMLPHLLSDDLCSLKPNVERLVFVAEIHYDKRGKRTNYEIYPAKIKSKYRLTYERVDRYLKKEEECDEKLLEMLSTMKDLTELLCVERFERGSIDFDLPEPTILISLTGHIENIIKSERLISHRIIEEFMISANRVVAEWFMENNIPTIYRVHEEPDPEKIKSLGLLMKNLGYSLKEKLTPKDLQKLLSEFRHTIYEKFVNKVVLRSMKQAKYSTRPIGHFGLALEHYLHFTSPIRRYADLVVHRQLLKYKFKGKRVKNLDEEIEKLEKVSEAISKKERIAWEIEKEIFNFASAKLMYDRIGEEFNGVVSSVTPSGLYIELIDFFVEGFLPVENMMDDYYIFDEKNYKMFGKRRKRVFHIGKDVRVKLVNVDIYSKRIEFLLLQ
ncbi:MAG: ribonuclease R [Proteobacteria bacterium]|nr:ribonuclease R [Pseudomonadota bacterium]